MFYGKKKGKKRKSIHSNHSAREKRVLYYLLAPQNVDQTSFFTVRKRVIMHTP